MLEETLRARMADKGMLLMTHIVIGFPDMDASLRLVGRMVEAGVDLMELQIPFSEPIADGPVILHANQKSLDAGTTVERCFEFAELVTKRFDIPFLFMTYYNILFRGGLKSFIERSKDVGVQGMIVPDLPPEEASEYLSGMRSARLDPIFIYSPSSSEQRMRLIAEHGSGFVYCVARKGVTGANTEFSSDLGDYLGRARSCTQLPLAVGFGVKSKRDVDFLRGKADIAVVGSESIRVLEKDGVDAVGDFLTTLR